MAQTIYCDMCKAEEAVMMQSNLKTGETIAVGEQCMFPYFYTQAMELAPAGTFEGEQTPEEAATPKTRKRASKPKTEPLPPTEPIHSYDESETTDLVEATADDSPPF